MSGFGCSVFRWCCFDDTRQASLKVKYFYVSLTMSKPSALLFLHRPLRSSLAASPPLYFLCRGGTADNATNINIPTAAVAFSCQACSVPLAEHTAYVRSARCVCEGVGSSHAHTRAKVEFLLFSWKPLGGVFSTRRGLSDNDLLTLVQAVQDMLGTRLVSKILCARDWQQYLS